MQPNALADAIVERISEGRVVVLSGAGVSAESGIPTFRGPEGYWTVGAKEYRPEELATYSHFQQMPAEVWQWYLYRRNVCRAAEPNDGHRALVKLQTLLGTRMTLVTQNVDGLHRRAGHESLFEIHGNIDFMRRIDAASGQPTQIPTGFENIDKTTPLSSEQKRLLCDASGNFLFRPHVLWFDEYYNEEWFSFDSAMDRADAADVLITIGSTGATNLPMAIAQVVSANNGVIVDINPASGAFSQIAQATHGAWLQGPAGQILPSLVQQIAAARR